MPICRFNCERLILVGDNKQLPPTLVTNEKIRFPLNFSNDYINNIIATENDPTLSKTLFVRINNLNGISAIVLRKQYRMHPELSYIANILFYNHTLQNGVSENQRSIIISALPHLCLLDLRHSNEIKIKQFNGNGNSGNSTQNFEEF